MDKATVAMARAHHTVSFTDPEGLAQTITVQDPKMRDERRSESDHGRCRRQPDRRRAALGGPRRVGVRASRLRLEGLLDFARRLLP